MPLVFASICPHPPILIPSVGQDNLKKIKQTQEAMERLEQDFYATKPETVIIISPHGKLMDEAFTINHSPVLYGDFDDFGDLETKLQFKNDLGLSYQIREQVETKLPVVLTTEEKLDHGVLIPLYYLTHHLKDIKVIPIGYSMKDKKSHFELGQQIRKVLDRTNKRVAVIASGDLSHRLNEESPAGYSPEGKKFDQEIVDLIKEKKTDKFLTLDEGLIKEAGECGYRSILILLGIMSEINYRPEIYSYEGPLGIGYLVANLII